MNRALVVAFLLIGACSGNPPLNAVGAGPHKGFVQIQQGAQVEIVPVSGGVQVYTADASGKPQKAAEGAKMTITAPSFSPVEVMLTPAEGGAYLVGTIPNLPQGPATVALVFPAGVTFTYDQIPLAPGAIAVSPVQGVPVGFVAPHNGTVSRVGDSLVEVVLLPKGEVQTYVYDLSGNIIPLENVKIPSVEVTYDGKPYKTKLKPSPEGYLTGKVNASVTIPAQTGVIISFVEPIILFEVSYAPTIILFPVYIVPIEIVIIVDTHIYYSKHKHKKY